LKSATVSEWWAQRSTITLNDPEKRRRLGIGFGRSCLKKMKGEIKPFPKKQ